MVAYPPLGVDRTRLTGPLAFPLLRGYRNNRSAVLGGFGLRNRYLALLMAMAAMPAIGHAMQQAAPAAPAPATGTIQQLFEQSTQATEAADYPRALETLTTLEGRVVRNPRSLAIVRVRKAMVLVELSRWAEARDLLNQAAPALPRDDASLSTDRYRAAYTLGRVSMGDLDYVGALAHFGAALAEAEGPAARIQGLLGQAQAGTFVDPAEALKAAEAANAIAVADPKMFDKASLAHIDLIRGRALLNLGQFDPAEKLFARAVKQQGGLTTRVDFDDLVTRSDASIAAMLAGHRDTARNYLVYTGAGRMPQQDFTQGADMALPRCGEDGIQPDDYAVVEFGISDSGAVSYARPVYGSRPGPSALAFARAVRDWSWRPDDVKKIPALFRFVTRLELRCSTAEGGPSMLAGPTKALADWLEAKRVPGPVLDNVPMARQRALLLQQAQLIRSQKGDAAVELVPVLIPLLAGSMAAREDVESYGPLLRQVVRTADAPPLAQLLVDRLVHDAAEHVDIRIRADSPYALRAADYQAEADSRATFAILAYDDLRPREKAGSQALLNAVIDDGALPANDPLRVAALVRRASLQATGGNLEAARADYAATGLSAQQCSIVDAKPSLRSAPVSSADYPTDMVSVGVEGWTRVQFDIAADGTTRNQRAVITYPPMIFGTNGTKIVTRAKYEQSYRPDGGLGCGGNMQGVTFRR